MEYIISASKKVEKKRRSALVVEAHVPVRYQVSASLISTSPEWAIFLLDYFVQNAIIN